MRRLRKSTLFHSVDGGFRKPVKKQCLLSFHEYQKKNPNYNHYFEASDCENNYCKSCNKLTEAIKKKLKSFKAILQNRVKKNPNYNHYFEASDCENLVKVAAS